MELRAALYEDPSATLDDLREAATTLEEIERIGPRRDVWCAHPVTEGIEDDLGNSQGKPCAPRPRRREES